MWILAYSTVKNINKYELIIIRLLPRYCHRIAKSKYCRIMNSTVLD